MTIFSKKLIGENLDRVYHRVFGRGCKCRTLLPSLFVLMYILTMLAFLVLMINRIQPIPSNKDSGSILQPKSAAISPPSSSSTIEVLSAHTITTSNQTSIHQHLAPSKAPNNNILQLSLLQIRRSVLSLKRLIERVHELYTWTIGRFLAAIKREPKHSSQQQSSNHSKASFPVSYAAKVSRDDAGYDTALSSSQVQLIEDTFKSAALHERVIVNTAKQTRFPLTCYTVFQYYEASDWVGHYHSLQMDEAVKNTILWRQLYGVNSLSLPADDQLLAKAFVYVSQSTDKHHRSIIYVKLGNTIKNETMEAYSRIVMYSVERADRIAMQTGSNHFVAIMDMEGFSFNKCPAQVWTIVKHLINLLKFHYPHRLNTILVINTGPAFSMIWRLLKPLLPKKAASKVHVADRRATKAKLDEVIGLANAEMKYGGDVPVPMFQDFDIRTEYLKRHY